MSKRTIEAIYPLSPMQQGMLFHSLAAPEGGVYVEQMSATLQGALHVDAFVQAWQHVVERHSILRTAFTWKRLDRMLQAVQRQVTLPIHQEDWRELPPDEQQRRLEQYLREDRARGFDPAQAPLLRLALLRTGPDRTIFVWSNHHVLLDGWSLPLLLGEIFTLYEGYRQGAHPVLPPARPYSAFIDWLQRQDSAQAELFWRGLLAGFAAPTPLGIDRVAAAPGGLAPIGGHGERRLQLDETTTARLTALGREHGLTLNTLVQGAWALLLSRYSGEDDVVFGATVAGRPPELPGVETMVGLFINTLPVRARVRPDAELLGWLHELQATQSELRQYEHTPLVQVQGWSDVPRGTALFESLVIFENYPLAGKLQAQRFSLTIGDVQTSSQTNYPLALIAGVDARLPLKIAFDRQRFDEATIDRTLGHLASLLAEMAAAPHARLGALEPITPDERRQIIAVWNNTARPFPAEACVHELFVEQAARTPDAIAVRRDDTELSYAELDVRSNRLAHRLRRLGIGPESVVGICMERVPELLVGILGVWKAGGAYLPIDPAFPLQRMTFMLEDSGAGLLLSHAGLAETVPAGFVQTLWLDHDWPELEQEPAAAPPQRARATNLAYVIYTSGSTGKPKGVLLEHRGLVNFALVSSEVFGFGPGQRVLQFPSISFDASVADIVGALLSGATLVLPPPEALGGGTALVDLLRAEAINFVALSPSLLAVLPESDLPALTTLVTAGEGCALPVARRWMAGRRLINGYGPTETTVGPSLNHIAELPEELGVLPIAGPLPNTRIYVLDQVGRLAPIGVPGEVVIGGVGVARGYLNRPELNAERFLPDPFSPEPGARMYRSGDLARWRPDGTLEFLGRLDHQVKVRGFRIELGEIEAALCAHPAVRNATVLAREDTPGEKRLAAYLVAQDGESLEIGALRAFLKPRLPEYMLPTAWAILAELPLTSSGKVDRKALPLPDGAPAAALYVAPRTLVEELLAGTWSRVLGVARVGADDDFFALGGHSLLATQVAARVREVFQVELPLRTIFEQPRLAALAAQIERLREGSGDAATPLLQPVPRDRPLPLSFSQQRLWFLEQLEGGGALYNNPALLRLTGELDPGLFAQSVELVVARHEALRTVFRSEGGEPFQVILDAVAVPVLVDDLRDLPEDSRGAELARMAAADAARPFDLAHGPLMGVRLIRVADDEWALLVNLHHIISDGWTMGILVREVVTAYVDLAAGRAPALPPLPLQYGDFALWQREYLQGATLERQLAYWRERLGGAPALLELPADRPRPALQSHRGAHATFSLAPELSERLRALSQQEGATLFMVLMATYMAFLGRYSGQADFCVGTPIAGRTRRELEGLVGFFVNTLVLRADLSGGPTFRELLRRVREATLGAYEHQDLPFELLVEAMQPERSLSYSPLFQAMFVLDNTPTASLALPGMRFAGAETESGLARFDLTLEMAERDGALRGSLEYNADLFDEPRARRMVAHFRALLEAVVANPGGLVGELPLLTADERRTMLVEWNATAAPFQDASCAHWLFERWAEREPAAPALHFEGQTLSYGELDRRANQVAHHLRALGIAPGGLVAVAVERSFAQIVAVLGALKAGGAFVPLDPAYPAERLAFMLADCGATVLLTQSSVDYGRWAPAEGAGAALRVVHLDDDTALLATLPDTRPAHNATADDLAYVIYTSGSTGRPKGTLLQHRGLCNLAEAQRKAFAIAPGKRVLQFSPFSFDASVWEMVMALANGATLVLARQETLASGPALLRLLHETAVTTVTLPPSLLAILDPHELPALETVVAAGEACTREIVAAWAPGRRFFNAYGPTETTVCASMARCEVDDEGNPPIGRPLPNFQLYVLDAQQQPLPVGVPGELHIGGVGLARGYLNRPELTAEKFSADPFSGQPGARLYRTGDLVRYRADGNLEFLGRVDHQVKLRGFRIELGEIEAALRAYPAVQDAAVIVRADTPGHERLVGYLISAPGAAGGEVELTAALREHLRERLPEYMVPAAFVGLERWPLSPSGKVDRKALPAPDAAALAARPPYVAPQTDAEVRIAAICAELLGVEQVGMHDNFFDLGGHSLLATRLIARIQAEFGHELPLRTLFEHPTVAGLATQLEAALAAAPGDEAAILELLGLIEGLSDEDARSQLK